MAYIKELKIGNSTASLRIEGEGIVHENVGIRIYFIIYSNIKINGTILLVPTKDMDKDFKYEVSKVEISLHSFVNMDVLDVSLINYVTTLLATLNDLDWLSIVKCVFIVYPKKLHNSHRITEMSIGGSYGFYRHPASTNIFEGGIDPIPLPINRADYEVSNNTYLNSNVINISQEPDLQADRVAEEATRRTTNIWDSIRNFERYIRTGIRNGED